MLSDSESDGDTVQQLTINEHYAKAYARKKEREELAKLKEKYGSDVESVLIESDDSEDTEEDEDGEELTPAVDAAILRTLARIKRKDPGIYDSKKDVFEEEQQKTQGTFSFRNKREDKSKPLHLRQHILQSQLQTSRSPSPEPAQPTHAEEQAALRKETISAFHTAVPDGSEDEDEDDILIPREKTKDEIEREEEEYRAFLTREVGEDIDGLVTIEEGRQGDSHEEEQRRDEEQGEREKEEKDGRKKRKRKDRRSKEQEDHEFLMSYILNRGWIDKSERRVPKYDEITVSKSKRKGKAKEDTDEDEAEHIDIIGKPEQDDEVEDFDEEEFDEVAETFESLYNFRFEEPDAATIPTHPREIATTVRREDNPRKAARERKKRRKEEKLLQKKEEVKRLKALKMKEIREKLERIGREGGKDADDEALQQLDLEGDWDPEAHDKQMAGIYGNDEPEGEDVELEKPTWDDDIDIADIIPLETEGEAGPSAPTTKKKNKKKRKKNEDVEAGGDGVDINEMDASVPPKSVSIAKPDQQEALDEAMNDVYGLEFNDLVGDLPTRFKYTPVLPDTYGLNATEILLADDAELNTLVGLRKIAPYRKDKGRVWDPKRGEKLRELRKKLGEKRGVVGDGGGVEGEVEVKTRKGKKERQKAKLTAAVMTEEDPSTAARGESDVREERMDGGEPLAKKRKRRHKNSGRTIES